MNSSKSFCDTLFNSLENYDYVILRGYFSLPDSIENDIDILIKQQHFKAAKKQILRNFEHHEWTFFYQVYFSCNSLFFINNRTKEVIHIDLFTSLNWRGIKFNSTDKILKNRVQYKNFFISSKKDELTDNIFSSLFANKKINQKYKSTIETGLKNKKNIDKKNLLLNKIILRNYSTVEKLEKNQKRLKHYFILRYFFRIDFKYFVYQLKKIKYNKGLFVVFLGADGSGKSTLIHDLKKQINSLFSNTSYQFHFCPTDKYNKANSQIQSAPHNQNQYSTIINWFKILYLVGQFNLGYAKKVFKSRLKNRVAIGDRYFYDIILDPLRYRMKSSMFSKFVLSFIPKPDLIIFCSGDPEKIYDRKKEVKLDKIVEIQKAAEDLSTKFSNWIKIETSVKSIEDCSSKICSEIINYLQKP